MFLLIGVASVMVTALVRVVFPNGLGWWWLLVIPAIPVLGVMGGFVLDVFLAAIEYLAFCWRRCPQCQCRRWSFGFTRGFGL